MAKSSKAKDKAQRAAARKAREERSGESSDGGAKGAAQAARHKSAEAATVAWMLSVLATIAAELLTLGGAALVAFVPREKESPGLLEMIPGSLGFTALVTGAVALILTPVVRRMRDVPPPRAIVITAIVAGGLPWLLLLVSLGAKLAQ